MKVTYDLPPVVISAVEREAGRHGATVDEYVAEHLWQTADTITVWQRIGEMVAEGMPDADIATVMHYTPGRIAAIRRSLGLPANRRYRAAEREGPMAETKIEYGVENPDFPDDPFISTGKDRERAIKLAEYFTKVSGRTIVAVERTITYTDWKPTNTGVVPPWIADKEDQ